MYFVMEFDTARAGVALVRSRPSIPGHDRLVFNNGVRIDDPLPIFDFILGPDGQGELTDYLWTPTPITLSARFKGALDSAGVDNIDYYPVRIVNQVTGEVRTDYFEANVVGVIDCLDEANSEIEYMSPAIPGRPPTILDMPKMVIDEGKIAGELVFRLSRIRDICFVHGRVKRILEAAHLTGVAFKPAQGFSW